MMRTPRTSLRRRFFVSFAGLLLGLGALSATATVVALTLTYRGGTELQFRRVAARFQAHLKELEDSILFRTRVLAQVARIEALGASASRTVHQLQLFTLRWLKREGLEVLGMGPRSFWERRQLDSPVVDRAFSGMPGLDLLVPDSGPPLLLAATPREGMAGVEEVIVTALPLEAKVLRRMAHRTGAEVALFDRNGRFLVSNLPDIRGLSTHPPGTVRLAGVLYNARAIPLRIGQRVVGTAVLLLPAEAFRSLLTRTAVGHLAALFLCFALFAILYWGVVHRATRDLEQLAAWAETFDPDRPQPPPEPSREDEVGVLTRSFSDLVERLEGALQEVEAKNRELARTNAILDERVREKTRELDQQRRLLDTVLRSMPQAVFLLDAERRVIYANRTARERFGATEGARCEELWALGCPCTHPGGGEQEVEKDGRVYLLSATPAGTGAGMILVAQDVTERRQLERQLQRAQRLESVGRLAAGVAHDFNNILGAMVPSVDLLLRKVDDPRLRGYLETVAGGLERASEVVRQLLTFSRSGSFRPERIDVNQTVEEALRLLRPSLKDVELVWKPAPDLGRVRGDPTQIQQAVLNLALNAVDAMEGKGILTVETYRDPARGMVVIAVEDTGPGVPEELADKVFDPFFTTKDPAKGTGLGLAIVFGVAERHGGQVRLVRPEGGGARFEILLPEPASRPNTGSPGARPGAVLVVDDDPFVLSVLIHAVRDLGYRVRAARSAEQALEIAAGTEEPLAGAVLDIRLKGMDGLELAKRLTERVPGLPVLFVSGYLEDRAAEITALGFPQPLAKPFTTAQLAARLEELFLPPRTETA